MRPLALALLLASPAAAAETAWSARLLGGRHLADGRPGSFSGTAGGSAASAVPLGERWLLLPSAAASWSGVESALDTAGGTTLFSETLDGRAALKARWQPATRRWRLKPFVGWRGRFLRETKDEAWFKGLFDRQTVDLGVEWERPFEGGAEASFGWAFSRTLFPNYRSLESSAPTDPFGRPLSRELAGRGVLDSDAHLLTAALSAPLPRGFRGAARLGFERRSWLEQRLVRADGLLSGDTREDLTAAFEASLTFETELRIDRVLAAGFSAAVSDTVSDQASFDPARARYEPRHYSNASWSVGPEVSLRAGDPRAPAEAGLSVRVGGRRWPHRSARDGVGAYTGDPLSESTLSVAADGAWPLSPGFALTARAERVWSRANDHFEALYRFNHDAASFLVGLRLER